MSCLKLTQFASDLHNTHRHSPDTWPGGRGGGGEADLEIAVSEVLQSSLVVLVKTNEYRQGWETTLVWRFRVLFSHLGSFWWHQIVRAFRTSAPSLSSFRVLLRLLSLSCIIHESPGGAGGGAGTMEEEEEEGGLLARDICLQPSHSTAQSSPT